MCLGSPADPVLIDESPSPGLAGVIDGRKDQPSESQSSKRVPLRHTRCDRHRNQSCATSLPSIAPAPGSHHSAHQAPRGSSSSSRSPASTRRRNSISMCACLTSSGTVLMPMLPPLWIDRCRQSIFADRPSAEGADLSDRPSRVNVCLGLSYPHSLRVVTELLVCELDSVAVL